MVMAFALFIVGGAARSSLGTMGDLTATRSLLPDMIALPGYLLLVVALLGFSRSRVRGEAQTSVVLDAVIAALALASLAWAFVVEPVLAEQQAPTLVKLVLTAYPSMSIFLVVVTLRIVFNGSGKHVPAFWLCVGAMSFMFVGDGLYMVADINLLQVPSQVLDLPYAAAFLLAGAMALHPTMRELTEPGPAAPAHAPPGQSRAGGRRPAGHGRAHPAEPAVHRGRPHGHVRLYFALTAAVVVRIGQALHIAARSEARLVYQANHDELTGLPNRRMMEEQLAHTAEERRGRRHARRPSLPRS